jgi:hypothetical protein
MLVSADRFSIAVLLDAAPVRYGGTLLPSASTMDFDAIPLNGAFSTSVADRTPGTCWTGGSSSR